VARGKATLGLALVLAAVALFVFLIRDISKRYAAKVSGHVTAEARSFGSVAFDVTHCVAGRAPVTGGVGVDLRGEHGAALRLIGGAKGPEVWLFPRGETTSFDPIGREYCSEWDVAVERIEEPGDGTRVVSGRVHVVCRIDGGHLEADVTFQGCPL
jgi:hypothetical protein